MRSLIYGLLLLNAHRDARYAFFDFVMRAKMMLTIRAMPPKADMAA